MSNESRRYRRPEVSGAYPSVSDDIGLETEPEEIFVVVTQAFDGEGNPLIHANAPTFDGYPGVAIWVELPDGRAGELVLSPIHGDSRKVGFVDIEDGTRCRLYSAKDGPQLDQDEPCFCGLGTYHRIYLSPALGSGEVALICDMWGCYRSRIVDNSEVLSWIAY